MSDKIIDPSKVRAKKMMLLFGLLSITMTFAGLTSAYIVSKGRPDWLVDFELPTLFFYSTFLNQQELMPLQAQIKLWCLQIYLLRQHKPHLLLLL